MRGIPEKLPKGASGGGDHCLSWCWTVAAHWMGKSTPRGTWIMSPGTTAFISGLHRNYYREEIHTFYSVSDWACSADDSSPSHHMGWALIMFGNGPRNWNRDWSLLGNNFVREGQYWINYIQTIRSIYIQTSCHHHPSSVQRSDQPHKQFIIIVHFNCNPENLKETNKKYTNFKAFVWNQKSIWFGD